MKHTSNFTDIIYIYIYVTYGTYLALSTGSTPTVGSSNIRS